MIQIKDAVLLGLLGTAQKSGIDLVAQTARDNGTVGYSLALWNNNYRIVTNSDILDLESYTNYYDPNTGASAPLRYMSCSVGGGITAYVATAGFSDARAKENIMPSSGTMEKLRKLRVVSFDWKDGHYPGHVSAGLIAQEVRKVLPEIVVEDARGMLGVSFDGLVPFLLEAVQEKDRQLASLQKQLNALEEKMTQLEKEVEEMQKAISRRRSEGKEMIR